MAKLVELATKIKRARAIAGLSQKELAVRLNLSDKTISAYEQGRAIPPVPTLEKIANITGQNMNFFINNSHVDKLDEINKKLDLILKEMQKLK